MRWLQIENEDLVFTLETIVEKFGEDMAPYAVGLCQHLTEAFWRMQVRPASKTSRSRARQRHPDRIAQLLLAGRALRSRQGLGAGLGLV